jgi:hypothetical protein
VFLKQAQDALESLYRYKVSLPTYLNLGDRNQPAHQIAQEKNGGEPAAAECRKPQPLALFVSKRFHVHGTLFP